MAKRIQIESWSATARTLHWLMALLILLQAIGGWVVEEMDSSPLKVDAMTAHKSLGITLLLLLVIRLLWRLTHAAPPPPQGSKWWEILAARLSHTALYLLMIAVPLSGWLSASTSIIPWKLWWLMPWPRIASPSEDLHEIAEAVHEGLIWALAAVLAVHVSAALYHHFVKRDAVLRRMLRGNP
jgi:cytochrome b561